MFERRFLLLVALVAWVGPFLLQAGQVGDTAAVLSIKEWIRGQPVDVTDGKNVYVLEFWGTLGPASIAAVPKLNELQKTFKDRGVVILGVCSDPADKVKAFVENSGTTIDYAIAADDDRKTARSYMVAFSQNTLPHAFVVGKERKIIWHGHPLQGLEQALEAIVTGKYNLDLAARRDAVRADLDRYLALARAGDPKAPEAGRQIFLARTNNAMALCDFAYRIVTDSRNKRRDFALAREALDLADKLAPPDVPQLVLTRGVLLFETGKAEEGIVLAKRAIDLVKDPEQKRSAQAYLRVMEARQEAEKEKKRPAGPPLGDRP